MIKPSETLPLRIPFGRHVWTSQMGTCFVTNADLIRWRIYTNINLLKEAPWFDPILLLQISVMILKLWIALGNELTTRRTYFTSDPAKRIVKKSSPMWCPPPRWKTIFLVFLQTLGWSVDVKNHPGWNGFASCAHRGKKNANDDIKQPGIFIFIF